MSAISERQSQESPALKIQAKSYPASWHGKIPAKICMDKTVVSELPFDHNRLRAVDGCIYDAYVNSYGAVCAIFEDGRMLGLKPYEFTVVVWNLPDGYKFEVTQ